MSDNLDGLRVLVVEDEPILAMSYHDILHEAGATVVGPFPSPGAAACAINGDPVDVALLDFVLSGGTSAELQDRLAAKGVPVVIVTAYPKVLVRQYNRQVVLSKPVPVELLRRAVRIVADRRDISAER